MTLTQRDLCRRMKVRDACEVLMGFWAEEASDAMTRGETVQAQYDLSQWAGYAEDHHAHERKISELRKELASNATHNDTGTDAVVDEEVPLS